MALSDYQPHKETIKGLTGSRYNFDVRGLSMVDITSIVRTHLDDLENLFDMYEKQGDSELSQASLGRFALALVKDAPGLVAHVIALASDEPDSVENAAKLPLDAQIMAIRAIGKMTFEGIGGVKKFMDEFKGVVQATKPAKGGKKAPRKK